MKSKLQIENEIVRAIAEQLADRWNNGGDGFYYVWVSPSGEVTTGWEPSKVISGDEWNGDTPSPLTVWGTTQMSNSHDVHRDATSFIDDAQRLLESDPIEVASDRKSDRFKFLSVGCRARFEAWWKRHACLMTADKEQQ
jgi:hypothetical protein